MSKYKRSGRPQSSRCKRTTRPCLEALESRLVLSTSATILPLTTSPAPFAGGGNAVIEGLYHTILGRDADPAGLAYWDAQLQAGESAAQVAGQFFQSPEYTTDVVESYYTTYLGRAGDPAGVASWVAKLQAGASEEQVAAAFLASPEYSAKHVTDGDFVQSLYENVLGRAGDPAGINSWTQALEAGTSRGAVVASFISSPESDQRAIDADYNDFLGRAGDTAGVNYWMAQVENGSKTLAEVAAQFAGSPEYATRASQEPAPATQLVVTTPPRQRHRERPLRPHRHRRERLGHHRHDLHRPGDPRPVRRDQRRRARRHPDRHRRQRRGRLHRPDHQHGRHGLHPHRLQRHPDLGARDGHRRNPVVTPTAIPVISFHGIGTDPANFPSDMPLSTFTADMTALHNAGYHSITLQQYLDWEAGKNPVLPSKPILLTDDDGDVSTMQMTSVLQSNGYTMVAFIVTGFIDNNDNFNVLWAQLQSMVASGTWEVAFHAGADGHYNLADPTDPPPSQSSLCQMPLTSTRTSSPERPMLNTRHESPQIWIRAWLGSSR